MKIYPVLQQKKNDEPFAFSSGIEVFSAEEAMYYCYHNHQLVQEALLSERFINWLKNSLDLQEIAQKLELYENAYARLLAFIEFQPFFDKLALEKELKKIEATPEAERLKTQGDFFAKQNDFFKAIGFYKESIKLSLNSVVFNNLGYCYMKICLFDKAIDAYKKALEQEERADFKANLAEAYIYANDFEKAEEMLAKIDGEQKFILLAELYFAQKKYIDASKYYQLAIQNSNNDEYIYKLADCYIKIRMFERAGGLVETVSEKKGDYLAKKAEIQACQGAFPKAIKLLEQALYFKPAEIELWIRLAYYFRKDSNINGARIAINKALSLDSNSIEANLENIKIRKNDANLKIYKDSISKILDLLKEDYRNKNNI